MTLQELLAKFSRDAYLAGANHVVVIASDDVMVHETRFGAVEGLLVQSIKSGAVAPRASPEEVDDALSKMYGERAARNETASEAEAK